MPRLNRIDAILTNNHLLRIMRCGCKYDDNARPIAEHVYACDEHLARLRQRTVTTLLRREQEIRATHRQSVARLQAWRCLSDADRLQVMGDAWWNERDDYAFDTYLDEIKQEQVQVRVRRSKRA